MRHHFNGVWTAAISAIVAAAGSMPALRADESLVAPGGKVEKLATGFVFTEGPAPDADGNVYFSDIPNNRIHKWSLDGKLSTFKEDSGASNGLFFDKKGNLLACLGANKGRRRLVSIDPSGKETLLADKYDGKLLNSPNDLWIAPSGGVYFSDPRYSGDESVDQDGQHVYYLSPVRKELIRVTNDLKRPNGVIGTPDGKKLYVADTTFRKIFVFAIQPDGTLADRKEFAPQGSDGMTMDEKGNVYLTNQSVAVYDPTGKKIENIAVPEPPANCSFGGKDRKTLFITARTSLYAVPMAVRGMY